MDEAACIERLTTYEAHTIRKMVPGDSEKATWAKAEITKESMR